MTIRENYNEKTSTLIETFLKNADNGDINVVFLDILIDLAEQTQDHAMRAKAVALYNDFAQYVDLPPRT